MNARSLSGLSVIVTRPAHQANAFCKMIESHGGQAIAFPTIEIQPSESMESANHMLESLHSYDIAIFVSPNAAAKSPQWNASNTSPLLIAVGTKTAQILRQSGFSDVITPDNAATSEALLSLPELSNIAGKRILIIAGEDGRTLLNQALQERGAVVERAEVYRRDIPKNNLQQLNSVWNAPEKTIIALTSGDAARNLVSMIGTLHLKTLFQLSVIVGSKRIARITRDLGFLQTPVIADNPGDKPMLEAVLTIASELREIK